MAAATTVRGSAGRGVAVRIVSRAARDVSRVPARFFRHAGARLDARRSARAKDQARDRRYRDAVAVCGVAALQLRRQLHLRRRRAARRAARAGARGRSVAAARAARRRRAARAARRRVDGRRRAPAAAPRPAVPRQERRCDPRHAALARRLERGRNPRAVAHRGRRRERRDARRRAPRAVDPHRGRSTLHRRRRRRALPRRARRAAARRHPGIAPAAGPRSHRRSRAALCADARAVHGRRLRDALRPRARRRRSGARAARRGGTARRRRVPSRRHAPRVDRRRRAAHAAAPLAREAAPRGRAGRSGRARPLHDDVAGHRAASSRR